MNWRTFASLKMFLRLGGGMTPLFTEKASPWAWAEYDFKMQSEGCTPNLQYLSCAVVGILS